MISTLSAASFFELPQLLSSLDIAFFRCHPQQNQRLFTILRDAVARQIKLCQWNLCRAIART
jgi:hypothetical protein